MPEGKEGTTVTSEGPPVARVESGEPVDGRQMVGIEAVLQPEQEHDRAQRGPLGRQFVHRGSVPAPSLR
jgi:hypothetical protein